MLQIVASLTIVNDDRNSFIIQATADAIIEKKLIIVLQSLIIYHFRNWTLSLNLRMMRLVLYHCASSHCHLIRAHLQNLPGGRLCSSALVLAATVSLLGAEVNDVDVDVTDADAVDLGSDTKNRLLLKARTHSKA
jgi:hypothetical protein